MTFNRSRLLRLAEYAAVSASVAGAIASIATNQIAYAVAPLSVAAALNLANRRQWEQQTEQRLTQTRTLLEQQLARLDRQNQTFQQRLTADLGDRFDTLNRALNRQQDLSDTTESLEALQAEVTQLIQGVSSEIQALQQALAEQSRQQTEFVRRSSLHEIEATLRKLQASLAAIEAFNLEGRLQSLEQIQPRQFDERQATLEAAIARLEQDFTQLHHRLDQLRREFEDTTTRLLREVPLEPEPAIALVAKVPSPSEAELSRSEEPIQLVPQLPTDEDYDLEINLGIDFGTGFTKVCFRDIGSDRSEVVTFSAEQTATLEQALLSTKIVILEDRTLLTGLTVAEWESDQRPVHQCLEFIKMRLADLDLPQNVSNWRMERIPELDHPETVENLCAYYLSRVIARAQQWIQKHRSDWLKHRTVRWSANVGVPVAYCDSPALERFRQVLSLAWLLHHTAFEQPLTLQTLTRLMSQLRHWQQEQPDLQLDCYATPELSAAMWPFISSPVIRSGFYTFFDIGDGTLDGVSFRVGWQAGEPYIDFYSSQVTPLGLTAFLQQVTTELQVAESEVYSVLLNGTGSEAHGLHQLVVDSNARKGIQKTVGTVVVQGKKLLERHHPLTYQNEISQSLEVFVGGGGGQTGFYRQTIQATHTDFRQAGAGIPHYQISEVPCPPDLDMSGLSQSEFYRFAIAYGLCVPEWEGPSVRLPSEVQQDEPPGRFPTKRRIRYEDTGDLC